jgi:hypothetical protein
MNRCLVLLLLPFMASAANATPVNVCTDARGQPVISDAKPATCTSESEVEKESREAAAARLADVKRQALVIAHANAALIAKYPDEASVARARNNELKPVLERIAASHGRLAELAKPRARIDSDLEFYPDLKKTPAELRRRVDQNDALVSAQQSILQNAEREAAKLNADYGALLARLRVLWESRLGSKR